MVGVECCIHVHIPGLWVGMTWNGLSAVFFLFLATWPLLDLSLVGPGSRVEPASLVEGAVSVDAG